MLISHKWYELVVNTLFLNEWAKRMSDMRWMSVSALSTMKKPTNYNGSYE